jgi:hypothetical protein
VGLVGRKKRARHSRTGDSRHAQPSGPHSIAHRPQQCWLTEITDRNHLPEKCERLRYPENGGPQGGEKNGIALGGGLWLKFSLLPKDP